VVERVRARDPVRPRADDDAELDLEVEGVAALRPDDRLAVASGVTLSNGMPVAPETASARRRSWAIAGGRRSA
jgi:hypothetical protein